MIAKVVVLLALIALAQCSKQKKSSSSGKSCEKDHHSKPSTCHVFPWITECEHGYDRNSPPEVVKNGGTTPVKIQLFIDSIRHLKDNEYWVYCVISEYWTDHRLVHYFNRPIQYNFDEQIEQIWRPDIFFLSVWDVSYYDVLTPNRWIKIENNGSMRLATTLQLKMACKKEVCTLRMESTSYSLQLMNATWRNDAPAIILGDNAKQVIDKTEAKLCDAPYNGITFSCLIATFKLKLKGKHDKDSKGSGSKGKGSKGKGSKGSGSKGKHDKSDKEKHNKKDGKGKHEKKDHKGKHENKDHKGKHENKDHKGKHDKKDPKHGHPKKKHD